MYHLESSQYVPIERENTIELDVNVKEENYYGHGAMSKINRLMIRKQMTRKNNL